MEPTKTRVTTLIITVATLIITACGGGGGDSGGDGGVIVPTSGVSISATNAKSITAAAINSVDTVQGMTAGTAVLTGVSVNAPASDFNYPDFFVQQLAWLSALDNLPKDSVTGVTISESEACANGGSVGLAGNVNNLNVLTAGDSLTLSFHDCPVGGSVTNGAMSLTVTRITPNFAGNPPYTLGLEVVLTNLSVNDGGLVATGSGDMSMLLTVDSAGNESMVLAGDSLTTSASGQAETLSNYRYEITINDFTGNYSLSLLSTFAGTEIGGSVSVTTITPFTGNDFVGAGDPTAGQLHVTTSIDGSQLWLIAQPDGINVQIDIDTDGDNSVDSTVMTTWAELESL
ncbi:MAG: hypothetical protein KZQ76_13380 [Candidatus Thiodiazotropha sp. (ex Epidulcina cf. delphinae)]|nr:hypothetical protein [Candidatus Thiodiazotropha sp. (ex Epidulcina cf. delphinae)]